MTELDRLAREVRASGRTLRRAAERGTFRMQRPSERKLVLPVEERAYLRAHWELLGALVQALRTQANVRLAVVFGSIARGDESPDSDLDVLVRLRRDDYRARADLADRLESASGRRIQLVSLEQAQEAPLLLADILRDGRVLVDREHDWPGLKRRAKGIERHALEAGERLERDAWGAPDALADHVGAGLPRTIAVRLADLRLHHEALIVALEHTTLEQFDGAARARDPRQLNQHVYPIERAFEIVCNYVAELSELGLREAGLETGDSRRTNLRLLAREKVIPGEQERRLSAALSARNELAHEYPDVRAAGIYQAARDLAVEAPAYLRGYVAWMRRLGFGES